jgi:dienelactone hydrolase
VNKDSSPALILFGENDYAYLIEQGKKYRDNFNAAHLKQISIETVAGADHSSMVMDVATSKDKISDKMAQYIQTVSAKR